MELSSWMRRDTHGAVASPLGLEAALKTFRLQIAWHWWHSQLKLSFMLKTVIAIIGASAVLAAVNATPVLAQAFSSGLPFQVVSPQPAVTVVDANGVEVGPYFPASAPPLFFGSSVIQDYTLVRIKTHNARGTQVFLPFLLPVSPNGFTSTSPIGPAIDNLGSMVVLLQYTTMNCTGTAYMSIGASGLTVPFGSYGVGGGILYYPTPGSAVKLSPSSFLNVLSSGALTACRTSPNPPTSLSPAQTLMLSTLGFLAPFHLSW